MTGGQPSEFTPQGFKTPTLPDGAGEKAADICEILTAAGASYVSRIIGIGDFSDALAEAISRPGFSLVEVMEICPSYGVKSNPGMKLTRVVEEAGLTVRVYADRSKPLPEFGGSYDHPSLLSDRNLIEVNPSHNLTGTVRIQVAGSAGEGVQSAAEIFAATAIGCGLNATKKGSYPVTVGIGFSASDVILSPGEILYTGSPVPDILLITSEDGLAYARNTLTLMKEGTVYLDSTLPDPITGAEVKRFGFREVSGARNAAMTAFLLMLRDMGYFSYDLLKERVEAKTGKPVKI